MRRRQPSSTLFPYTTLFRSSGDQAGFVACQRFGGEDELGGGSEGVVAHGHGHGACVTALTRHADADARLARDGRDDAHGKAFMFQNRALLDMDLTVAE